MLSIPKYLVDQMHTHVNERHPEEACGLIARGLDSGLEHPGREGRLYRHIVMRNVDPNPRTAYAWDPEEHARAYDRMATEGTEPWVIYHSHTETAPEPSPVDIKAAWYPKVHYVIWSTVGGNQDRWWNSYLCTEPGVLKLEEVFVE